MQDDSRPDNQRLRPDAAHQRPLRILHCPTDVGGNPPALAQAERALGLDSHCLAFRQSRFEYGVDEILWTGEERFLRHEWKRWKVLRRALRDYDIVHFNFGCTFFPHHISWRDLGKRSFRNAFVSRLLHFLYSGLMEQRDLVWLKRAGVGIVVTFQGDDARQGDFSREHFDISIAAEVSDDYYTPDSDAVKRKRIERFDRFADRIYAVNPDLLHVLPARSEFMPYASVDPQQWQPLGPAPGTRKRPVVLHAPSHRGAKGTRFLQAAVKRLQEEDGLDFEFLLVENLPHSEASRLYRRADLLVDQLLAGYYGALAVELMALGKPVVCYLREDDFRFLPAEMRREMPVIPATPDSIYHVLKEWLTVRRSELAPRGAQSREFAVRWHHPLRIAERLKRDYLALAAESRGTLPSRHRRGIKAAARFSSRREPMIC